MIGGVGLQIIRDWVLHFNERGPDGLLNGKSPGQPSKLNDVHDVLDPINLPKLTRAERTNSSRKN